MALKALRKIRGVALDFPPPSSYLTAANANVCASGALGDEQPTDTALRNAKHRLAAEIAALDEETIFAVLE